MSETGKKKNKALYGLRAKIFRLCILLITAASIGFAIFGIIQLINLRTLTRKSGNMQIESVKQESQEYMMTQTANNMKDVAWATSLCIFDEIWMIEYAAESLIDQVAEIIAFPQGYHEYWIEEPSNTPTNEPVLQLLMPAGYNPSEEEMEIVGKLASLTAIMRGMIQDPNTDILDIMIALPNGMTLDMDSFPDRKFKEDGSLYDYDPRLRSWWIGAVQTQEGFIGTPTYSELLGLEVLEYAVPVYLEDELVAVVESTIMLDSIHSVIETVRYGNSGFGVLINDDGRIIYSPNTTGELAYKIDMKSDIRASSNEKLKSLLEESKKGEVGFTDITIDGKDYYVAYGSKPIDTWNLFMFVGKEEVEGPTQNLLSEMDSVNKDTMQEFEKNYRNAAIILLIVAVLLVISAAIAARMFSDRLTGPINRMTESVGNISGDHFSFEMDDIYHTGDEIEVMAGTFQELSARTQKYIEEITQITAEKERIGTELRVAAKIQEDMLPKHFPIFPDRKEFDLYATMSPAKEVGGDFYDMFLIDEDHLCLVMGDVCGKGVPAALFMAISKAMLKSRAQSGGTPSEILHDVNNSLCEGNDENMFVTVWLGILTISTGELIQASAGHEYPVIKKKGEEYKLIVTDNDLVIGYIKGFKYNDLRFELAPGDSFFMYTDGLPEATNAEDKRYEIEGMMGALNRHRDDEPWEFLPHIREEVDAFVKEAPQFDDLTMLIIRYNGKENAL